MLPLRYPGRWNIAGGLILAIVLAMAFLPAFNSAAPGIPEFDKWLHGLVFLLLTVWFTGQYARRFYVFVLLGLFAYGALIEVGQALIPYRTAEWGDLAADCVGVIVGILIATAVSGGWSLQAEAWLEKRIG
jgi:VanZ family protein